MEKGPEIKEFLPKKAQEVIPRKPKKAAKESVESKDPLITTLKWRSVAEKEFTRHDKNTTVALLSKRGDDGKEKFGILLEGNLLRNGKHQLTIFMNTDTGVITNFELNGFVQGGRLKHSELGESMLGGMFSGKKMSKEVLGDIHDFLANASDK